MDGENIIPCRSVIVTYNNSTTKVSSNQNQNKAKCKVEFMQTLLELVIIIERDIWNSGTSCFYTVKRKSQYYMFFSRNARRHSQSKCTKSGPVSAVRYYPAQCGMDLRSFAVNTETCSVLACCYINFDHLVVCHKLLFKTYTIYITKTRHRSVKQASFF